ncbi:polysaccharide pyruvyl transferase family protein [Acetobacter cibinongensis]|uniref:Polysaccharide pyruvyl transferase domain-containing protein n=1 Tax=Acetobacter cibinongensis TaxID=146475 RepID=A0A1Z5YYK7_9PROT|nr:polysaccharide pyruvyl transferase family protein [Acetobacter cibinongensis]OUJ04401.1 hypothetical protein HK14_08185 [Acetobacter cibinongensis]
MLEKVIPYNGWNFLRNLGDRFGANVIDYVSGALPVISRKEEPHVLAVGSILFMANQNSHLWGIGCMNSSLPDVMIDSCNVHALRGKYTADLLTKAGYTLRDIPFGDPGILAAEVISKQCSQYTIKTFTPIVIIPHYSNYKSYKEHYGASREVKIIDMATDRIDIIKEIESADIVISESLHGLIFGCALGKKITWVGNQNSDTFKYYDWMTTIDSNLDVFDPYTNSLEQLAKESRGAKSIVDKQALVDAFPSYLGYYRTSRGHINYRNARSHEYVLFIVTREQLGLDQDKVLEPITFFEAAKRYCSKMFSTWDEPVYAFVSLQGEGVVPQKNQIHEILFEMDHYSHDFSVIITRDEIDNINRERSSCGAFLDYAPGTIAEASTLLIRPQDKWGWEAGYVIFCV